MPHSSLNRAILSKKKKKRNKIKEKRLALDTTGQMAGALRREPDALDLSRLPACSLGGNHTLRIKQLRDRSTLGPECLQLGLESAGSIAQVSSSRMQ